MHLALVQIEPAVVALTLLRLHALAPETPGLKNTFRQASPSDKAKVWQLVYEAFRDRGELYALGEATLAEHTGYANRQTEIAGGGLITFSTIDKPGPIIEDFIHP